MQRILLALSALALAAPAVGQEPVAMSPEQTMQLRCAAAFAIASGEQARGDPAAAGYPPLKDRGKEYFVRASAHLMDELHLTREQIAQRLRNEVAAQQHAKAVAAEPKAYADSVLQPCLAGLQASGL